MVLQWFSMVYNGSAMVLQWFAMVFNGLQNITKYLVNNAKHRTARRKLKIVLKFFKEIFLQYLFG
jgi:hypothetical protein